MIIGLIDYGMGNLFSVSQALQRLEATVKIVTEPSELDEVDGILLPGVGAFPDAIKRLQETGFAHYLMTHKEKKPLLGICLGMQLLFEESDENETTKGLGFFKGSVRKFPSEVGNKRIRIPHMGWNELQDTKTNLPLPVLENEHSFVYFVHSFFVTEYEIADLVSYADYETFVVPAIFQKENITAMQFHPEKSGVIGVELLKNWLQTVKERN